MSAGAFDTAAASFDAARGFPAGVGEQVAQSAAAWIGQGARVLEVGVGTGRIARPLLALGVRVVGLDLARQMMEQLRATLPAGQPAPGLVQGDANCLPVAANAFDAVVSVHVLQLLADWSEAVSEVRRVLRPGGVFLNGYEWRPPDSPGARLMDRWRFILAAAGGPALAAGARDFGDLTAELAHSGAACDEQTVGQWSTTRTLRRQLETIEHRTGSVGSDQTKAVLVESLAQLRLWAAAEFGALDEPQRVPHRFVWQRFAWPIKSAPDRPA
jgi:SAM-dependent methyltransferase